MTSVFSWENSISLCPASFRTPRPNLPVTPGIEKGVRQDYILSPCLFNLYAEYILRNARLEETQAGIKIAGRNINNFRYADDTTLMAESEEELNEEPLDEGERGE